MTSEGRVRLTLPAKCNAFFERMVEWLSGLHRYEVCGFQLVVPLRRRIGVVDEHQGRFVAQAHRLTLHRLSILCHENIGKVAEDGLGKWNPAETVPRRGKIDAALLVTDRRDRGAA